MKILRDKNINVMKKVKEFFNSPYVKYFLIIYLISALILDINYIKEETSELNVNEVSPKTFVSTKDLEYVNNHIVDEEIKREMDNKTIYYKYDDTSEKAIREYMSEFYQITNKVVDIKNNNKPSNLYGAIKQYSEDSGIDYNLLTAIYNSIETLGYSNLLAFEEQLIRYVTEGNGFTEEDLDSKKVEMKAYVESVFRDAIIQEHFFKLIDNDIKASKAVDESKTNEILLVKINDIKEKYSETIQKGQKIVDKGEVLTQRDLDIIEQLNLNSNATNFIKFLKMNIVLLLLMIGVYLLALNLHKISSDIHKLRLLGFLFVSGILLISISLLTNMSTYSVFIFIPLIIILADFFLSKRIAIYFTITFSIIIGYMLNSISLLLVYLLIGMSISLFLTKVEERSDITKISFYVSIITLLITYTVDGLSAFNYMDYLLLLLNVLVSFFLSTTVFSIIEKQFQITTSFTLMELQQHKILEELTLKAPGTMTHSNNVAHLAKNAALRIGANANLVYTAGLLHDIGKLHAPEMFTENHNHFNLKENPHNKLTPIDSAIIIKKHVEYGIELAEKLKFPREIKNLIATHHGDSTIRYFYHKAIENAEKRNRKGSQLPSEKEFKYLFGKPKTKEEGILMLCDVAEAVSKSFDECTREYLEERLPKYIQGVVQDGQLNECDLTFKEIQEIENSIIDSLVSLNVTRTKYQNQKD